MYELSRLLPVGELRISDQAQSVTDQSSRSTEIDHYLSLTPDRLATACLTNVFVVKLLSHTDYCALILCSLFRYIYIFIDNIIHFCWSPGRVCGQPCNQRPVACHCLWAAKRSHHAGWRTHVATLPGLCCLACLGTPAVIRSQLTSRTRALDRDTLVNKLNGAFSGNRSVLNSEAGYVSGYNPSPSATNNKQLCTNSCALFFFRNIIIFF